MRNFDKMRYCSLLSAVAVMVISLCAAVWYSMSNMDAADQSARFRARNYFINVWRSEKRRVGEAGCGTERDGS